MKKHESEPKSGWGFLTGLVGLFEMFTGLVSLGLVALCFVVFDWLHVTDTATQVLLVIAPFLVLAFLLWRRGTTK